LFNTNINTDNNNNNNNDGITHDDGPSSDSKALSLSHEVLHLNGFDALRANGYFQFDVVRSL
jgi:hypothetical protein